MISIAIGDIKNNPDYAWLSLQGEGLLPSLVGSTYTPSASTADLVEETIKIDFKGTPAQIHSVINRLETQIALAMQYTLFNIGVAHYLRVKYESGGYYYYTKILTARLEPAGKSLIQYSRGSLSIWLHFTRNNYFDSEEIAVPIDNANGPDNTTGLEIENNPSTNKNFFFIDDGDLSTELPTPLRIELTNNYATDELQDIIIGSIQYDAFTGLPVLVYEGEDAAGGTSTEADAGSSDAKFERLTWNTVIWTDILQFTILSTNVTKFKSKSVMPIIRLSNLHAYDDLKLKLNIVSGGITLYEGASITADKDLGYILFPPFSLPPTPLYGSVSATPLDICLQAIKETVGAYTIDVDYMLLMPLSSYSKYDALVTLAQND